MFGAKVPSRNFVKTLAVNVGNERLSDEAFREFVRNTLPIVEGGEALDENLKNRKVIHVGTIEEPPEPDFTAEHPKPVNADGTVFRNSK